MKSVINIVDGNDLSALEETRKLFRIYAESRNYDEALGDFEKELVQLPGAYSQPTGILLLAKRNDHLIGCVAYQKIEEEVCEMKRLFVQDEHRGKGTAKELISFLIEHAKKNGYLCMKLDTHPTMLIAEHLYLSFGFKRCKPYNNNPTPGIKHFELNL